jgi:protein TonB
MKYITLACAILILAVAGCTVEKKPTGSNIAIIPIDSLPSPDDFVVVEQLPVMTYEQIPPYPRRARMMGIEGTVIIQAFVDKEGTVRRAQAARCDQPGWGFEESAVWAAYRCRYSPAIQNGRPIGVWVSYKVTFTLG